MPFVCSSLWVEKLLKNSFSFQHTHSHGCGEKGVEICLSTATFSRKLDSRVEKKHLAEKERTRRGK
jgi:hypothetical protein